MLFAFAEPETVKEAVDIHFWTVTIWAILGTALIGAGGVALTAITVYQKIVTAIRDAKTVLQKDIKQNTDAQNEILPAVTAKVDSATKDLEAERDKTKKIAVIQAERMVEVLGAKLEQKADVAAQKVAVVAKEGQDALRKSIHGDDGTCLTARMTKLEEQHKNLAVGQEEMKRSIDELTQALKGSNGKIAPY